MFEYCGTFSKPVNFRALVTCDMNRTKKFIWNCKLAGVASEFFLSVMFAVITICVKSPRTLAFNV